MENPHSILKKVFGYDSFRPGQEEYRQPPAGRAGCAGGHAHRCGQIHLLSGTGAAFAGHHHRGVPAGQPDEGSGGSAGAGGRGGGFSEQQPDRQPEGADAAPRPGGLVQDHLCGTGAAGDAGLPAVRAGAADQHGHGGRGALHQPVGTGLPPQLSAHQGICGQPAQPPGHRRVHCHRHRPCAGGYPHPSGAASTLRGDHQLRPPQPVLRDPAGAAQPKAQGAAGTGAQRGQSCGHRVLQHHPAGGRDGAAAAEPQHPGGSLPRKAGCGHPAAESGRFSLRPGTGDGCHQCFRHGHRQAQRAVRHPL